VDRFLLRLFGGRFAAAAYCARDDYRTGRLSAPRARLAAPRNAGPSNILKHFPDKLPTPCPVTVKLRCMYPEIIDQERIHMEDIMNDLDHMLNGSGSRRHHQAIIRQVQYDNFAREVQAAQGNGKTSRSVRAVLVAVINLVTR
jgi:hypothetical protein